MKIRTLYTLLSITSLLISAYIGFQYVPTRYSYIAFLPCLMSVLYILFAIFLNMKQNIATLLITSLTFIRYSIVPLLYTMSNYSSLMSIASYSHGYDAISLMMYEATCIVIVTIIANRTTIQNARNTTYIEHESRLSFIIYSCLLFCIASAVIYPNIQDIFKSIFELDSEEFNVRELEEAALGSIDRIVRSLFSTIFNITRILLPVFIMNIFSRNVKSIFWNRVMLILLVGVQFLLLTSTFAEAIISGLVIILSAAHLGNQAMKGMMKWAALFSVAIIITYFSIRFKVGVGMYGGYEAIEYISYTTSAYFTGIDNVAAAMNLPRDLSGTYLTSNIISTIPFHTTLFGPREVHMQTFFNEINGTYGQISPTIGNGYFYFGYILAPIISMVFTYFSIILCRKANQIKSIWRYTAYIFMSIVFALGIAMYNEIIALSWINGWGIPMLIIAYIVDKPKRYNTSCNGNFER